MNTIKRPIKGTKGKYTIDTNGTVTSYMQTKPRILKPGKVYKLNKDNPHLRVTLYKNNRTQRIFVHRLVAKHFIPNPNKLPNINHKDGNKSNNHVDNLEWCTQSENMLHSYHTLKNQHVRQYDDRRSGELNGSSKLTQNQVATIRALYQNRRMNQTLIAKRFNTTRVHINKIINNKLWTK